jgi:hypothetical protein
MTAMQAKHGYVNITCPPGTGGDWQPANYCPKGWDLADLSRFWAKVDRRAPGGCWPWTASTFGGRYGQFYVTEVTTKRNLLAHRVAWELASGQPVPDGMHVMHTCDVPRCCNPAHLKLGTHTDNMRDASSKGRLHAPRPKRHKVTDAQVEEIRALVAAGTLSSALAARFNVTESWISLVVRGLRRNLSRPSTKKEQAA